MDAALAPLFPPSLSISPSCLAQLNITRANALPSSPLLSLSTIFSAVQFLPLFPPSFLFLFPSVTAAAAPGDVPLHSPPLRIRQRWRKRERVVKEKGKGDIWEKREGYGGRRVLRRGRDRGTQRNSKISIFEGDLPEDRRGRTHCRTEATAADRRRMQGSATVEDLLCISQLDEYELEHAQPLYPG